jgi:small GTP-binding protein
MPRTVGTRELRGAPDAVVYRIGDATVGGTHHELRLSRAPMRPTSAGLPTFKVVLLGDCSVGKSSLQRRFVQNAFDAFCEPTVGVDFVARTIELFDSPQPLPTAVREEPRGEGSSAVVEPSNGGSRPGTPVDSSIPTAGPATAPVTAAVLQLWDTAGQERNFNSLSSAFLRGALGAVLCYDVTRRSSLHNLGGWMARARTLLDPDAVIAVVGTKTDLRHDIEVTEEEGEAFAHALGCRHFLSSSYTGDGVPSVFFQLLLCIGTLWQVRGCANVTCNELAAPAVRPSLLRAAAVRGVGNEKGGGSFGSAPKKSCCG